MNWGLPELAIVIHVPHASTHIPNEVVEQFEISRKALDAEAKTSADLYTDLLAQSAWPTANIVSAQVSRLVVDVERYADDGQEVMAQFGRGMVYTHTHDGIRIRRDLSEKEREQFNVRWYDRHWERLRSETPGAVLIDLHSYPEVPWSVELDQDAERPEFDLGTSGALTPAVGSQRCVNISKLMDTALLSTHPMPVLSIPEQPPQL